MYLVIQLTEIFFLYIFGFHPQFLKMLQSHKSETSVLLLMKVTFGPHPRVGAGCQEDQSYDYRIGTFSSTTQPLGRRKELEVESANGQCLSQSCYIMKPL